MNSIHQSRVAVITSKFNEEITTGLLQGAMDVLKQQQVRDVVFVDAPGAFEIPLLAKALAKTKRVDGIVCLGCVIKGDTAHFEFISLGATIGIQQASLETGIPITFGIITTYTEEQAHARSKISGPDAALNKGREAAMACIESMKALKLIQSV